MWQSFVVSVDYIYANHPPGSLFYNRPLARALMGPWAIKGQAGPYWVPLGANGSGPNGPAPLGLYGLGPDGAPWALMRRALLGALGPSWAGS